MRELVVHKGETEIGNKKAVRKFFDELPTGKWLLTVKNINNRTLPMNDYLHGVLIPEFRKALEGVGYEIKDDYQAKLILKNMFLKSHIERQDGSVMEFVRDTRDLSTSEMSVLFDEVIRFSAEHLSYQIPYPSEQLTINL